MALIDTLIRLLMPGYSYKPKMATWVLFACRFSFGLTTSFSDPIFHVYFRFGWKYISFQVGRFKGSKINGIRID